MLENTHPVYMKQALELAQRGRLTVSPNPMVGCLIVKNQQIIGQGWHQRAGEPHAEVLALQDAGTEVKGASAYVTLEPCCHFGRTPPCVNAIIEAGIKNVYVACLDPNPLVAGKGVQALQAAGIQVEVGILEAEAIELNEIFFHYIKNRRPWVLAKWAMSLDGFTIAQPHDSRQISGPESSQHTHEIRQQLDAILVGAQTAINDNPQLTARSLSGEAAVLRQPLRIVLSNKLNNLPLDLKLFDTKLPGKTLLVTTPMADPAARQVLESKGIEVLILPADIQGQVDLPSLLDELGKREITSLLVEGGRKVQNNFFNQNLVNRVQVYLAPTIIGTLDKKRYLSNLKMHSLGNDFSFSAEL